MISIQKNENSIIELKNVHKIFGFTNALKSINLTVKEGETVGFIGHNGAGKSTLLKIISLLVTPTTGSLRLFGTEVKENQHLLKKEIGVLLSESFFYEDLTGRENLNYYLKMNKRTEKIDQTIKNVIKDLNLKLYIDRPVSELSTGMAKKLEILRVSLPKIPKLLLLDEPFSGLDRENRKFLISLITDREPNTTVIICSHDFKAVAEVCSKVILIEKGRITNTLSPPEYDFFLNRQA